MKDSITIRPRCPLPISLVPGNAAEEDFQWWSVVLDKYSSRGKRKERTRATKEDRMGAVEDSIAIRLASESILLGVVTL